MNERPTPSPRPLFVGRNSLPQGQGRPMQQQQPQQYQLHQQMNYNHPSVHMPGNYAQSNLVPSPIYHNNIGISPAPPARMNPSMQSPAAATTAPVFGQSTQQQQIYNHCPMNSPMHQAQQQPSNTSGIQQQPGNMVHGYIQQNYNQLTSNNGTVVMGANMGYNNFNQNPTACNNSVGMNSGASYMVNQCGHVNPNNPGFPSGNCNHQSAATTCNNMTTNNWQCYPNNMAPGQQMSFQPNGGWNSQMTANQPTPMGSQPQMMYSMQTSNRTNNYSYSRPPPYPTAIQCQDVSQSQDFNRVRAAHNQNSNTNSNPNTNLNAHMNPNPNPNVVPNPIQSAPISNTGQTNAAPAPGNMRPETYQRTLEYVQQCQTWTTGDSARAAKENKPPHGGTECVKPVETVVPPSRGSPAQDAVSSSTDRQDQTNVSAMIMSASNMVVHDMNTSLNSLMQENRFLQMIQ